MKTKMTFLAFCMTIMFCMSACAGTTMYQLAAENKAAEDEAIGDVTITISLE